MFALIHFPSTKVCKKNKVLKKSAIKVLRGNDRWKNRQECLFYQMTLFFFFCPRLKSRGYSNFQKPPHQNISLIFPALFFFLAAFTTLSLPCIL